MERQQTLRTRALVTTGVMCALLVILAQITIPLGAVPFSMAVFGVALVGAMLPPVQAMACIGCYFLLGLIGVPVFAQFKAGPQVLFGPTGGYLFGYFVLALAASLFFVKTIPAVWRVVILAVSLPVFYLLGTFWFVLMTGSGWGEALAVCVLPFVIPDVCKIAGALAVARVVKSRRQKVYVGGKTE